MRVSTEEGLGASVLTSFASSCGQKYCGTMNFPRCAVGAKVELQLRRFTVFCLSCSNLLRQVLLKLVSFLLARTDRHTRAEAPYHVVS